MIFNKKVSKKNLMRFSRWLAGTGSSRTCTVFAHPVYLNQATQSWVCSCRTRTHALPLHPLVTLRGCLLLEQQKQQQMMAGGGDEGGCNRRRSSSSRTLPPSLQVSLPPEHPPHFCFGMNTLSFLYSHDMRLLDVRSVVRKKLFPLSISPRRMQFLHEQVLILSLSLPFKPETVPLHLQLLF